MSSKQSTQYERDHVTLYTASIAEQPFHWHSGLEIIYVVEGTVQIELHKDPEFLNTAQLRQGDVYLFSNNQVHRIYETNSENVVHVLTIAQERIKKVFADADTLEFDNVTIQNTMKEIRDYGELQTNIAFIISNIIYPENVIDMSFSKMLDAFLYWIIKTFEIITRQLSRQNQPVRYYERLISITNYIENNVENKNILESISQNLYLNKDYISRELKNKVGYSYQQLVNFYRIQHAIHLLLNTDLNVTEISEMCGFSATRYFYKEFRKFYEAGPLHFRKKFKQMGFHMHFLEPKSFSMGKNQPENSPLAAQLTLQIKCHDPNKIYRVTATGTSLGDQAVTLSAANQTIICTLNEDDSVQIRIKPVR